MRIAVLAASASATSFWTNLKQEEAKLLRKADSFWAGNYLFWWEMSWNFGGKQELTWQETGFEGSVAKWTKHRVCRWKEKKRSPFVAFLAWQKVLPSFVWKSTPCNWISKSPTISTKLNLNLPRWKKTKKICMVGETAQFKGNSQEKIIRIKLLQIKKSELKRTCWKPTIRFVWLQSRQPDKIYIHCGSHDKEAILRLTPPV